MNLCIKWSHNGPVVSDIGTTVICNRCDGPVGGEPELSLFVVRTWWRVCDWCGAAEDPALTQTLFRIRAEFDRKTIGPHAQQWLATLDPAALRQVTAALAAAGIGTAEYVAGG